MTSRSRQAQRRRQAVARMSQREGTVAQEGYRQASPDPSPSNRRASHHGPSRKARRGGRQRDSGRSNLLLGLAGVVVVGVAVLVVILVVTSNRGGGSAGSGSTGSSASAASSKQQQAVAYASCMRSHGDPGFPDPNSQGGFPAIQKGSPQDPNSPQFQAANPSCKSLLPSTGSQQQQQNQSANLQFAQCMRSNGVPDFPDPGSNGAFLISGSVQNEPQYQSAYSTCKHLLPNGGQNGLAG